MRLKFMGHICPECGKKCDIWQQGTRDARRRKLSGWMGFYYWSVCYRCNEAYLILFDQDKRFITILPNGGASEHSGLLVEAGEIQSTFDEIPF